MTGGFDIAIVGARCAGAALATFLARAGARVLLVDRDRLPSDQVMSTHTIHPPGVAILDELGVGGALREVTPPSPRMRIRKETAAADLTFPDGRHELCPRRERLDGLLQDAAIAAGAELRDRTRATALRSERDRVTGIEVEHDGRSETLRAGLVVGADGRRSWMAEAVGAEEYLGYDAPRAMFWSYWDAPPAWRTDRFPFDMYISHIGDDVRVVFQTDHDQLLVGSLPPVAAAQAWRADPLAALCDNLAREEVAGPLVAGARPSVPVRGTIKERYFFRRAAGPGWALVGDAGHHKEFVVGDGITEALLQARSLAAAIGEGRDAAVTRWWRHRDVEALPTYCWGRDEGSLDPVGQLQPLVVARVAREPRLQRMMIRVPEHRCSSYDALPASAVLPLVLGAVARGRFGVIPELRAQLRRAADYRRELERRTRLLEAAGGRAA